MFSLLGSAERGFVRRLDVTRVPGTFDPARVVTAAVRSAKNELLLLVWDITRSGDPIVRGRLSTGFITEVAVAGTHDNQVVTAMRDSQRQLRLITWSISSDGRDIDRLSTEVLDIEIETVDIGAGLAANSFITACRNREGNLLVSDWKIDASGDISHLKSETYGGASEISVTDKNFFHSSLIAMKDAEERLRIINFESNPLRRGFTLVDDKITRVAIGHNSGLDLWIAATVTSGPAAVRTGPFGWGRLLIGGGYLNIIAYIDQQKLAEFLIRGSSGAAYQVAALGVSGGGVQTDVFVTVHKGVSTYRKLLPRDRGKPRITFTAWKPDRFDRKINQLSRHVINGDFDQIALADASRITGQEGTRFVSAMRDKSENLRLMVWDVSD